MKRNALFGGEHVDAAALSLSWVCANTAKRLSLPKVEDNPSKIPTQRKVVWCVLQFDSFLPTGLYWTPILKIQLLSRFILYSPTDLCITSVGLHKVLGANVPSFSRVWSSLCTDWCTESHWIRSKSLFMRWVLFLSYHCTSPELCKWMARCFHVTEKINCLLGWYGL